MSTRVLGPCLQARKRSPQQVRADLEYLTISTPTTTDRTTRIINVPPNYKTVLRTQSFRRAEWETRTPHWTRGSRQDAEHSGDCPQNSQTATNRTWRSHSSMTGLRLPLMSCGWPGASPRIAGGRLLPGSGSVVIHNCGH
jgi:hypothetical protein